jgi:hypothetical protein
LICIVLTTLPGSYAEEFQSKQIVIDTEHVTVTPQLTSCVDTEKVFRIERENYISGAEQLSFTYTYKHQGNGNHSKNITKTINKYTTSSTGNFIASDNPQQIFFKYENTSLQWNVSWLCAVHNVTTPPEISPINESVQTPQNDSEVLPPIPETNDTETTAPETITETQVCPKQFAIDTDAAQYEKGEKILFRPAFDSSPEEYSITYWIEDAWGETVKKKITTNNQNEKSYTLSKSLQDHSYLHLLAKASTSCGNYATATIIGIDGETQQEVLLIEVEDVKELVEATIQITSPEETNYKVELETIDNKKIRSLAQLVVEPGSQTTMTLQFIPPNEAYAKIVLSGKQRQQEAYFATGKEETVQKELSLVNTYTRQTKLADDIHWYVRSQGTAPYVINVSAGNQSQRQEISTDKEITSTFTFSGLEANTTFTTVVQNDNEEMQEEETILFAVEKTFKDTLEKEKENREEVQVPVVTGAVVGTQISSKTKLLGGSVLLLAGIQLTIYLKKRFIKEGTFIKHKASQATTHKGATRNE